MAERLLILRVPMDPEPHPQENAGIAAMRLLRDQDGQEAEDAVRAMHYIVGKMLKEGEFLDIMVGWIVQWMDAFVVTYPADAKEADILPQETN